MINVKWCINRSISNVNLHSKSHRPFLNYTLVKYLLIFFFFSSLISFLLLCLFVSPAELAILNSYQNYHVSQQTFTNCKLTMLVALCTGTVTYSLGDGILYLFSREPSEANYRSGQMLCSIKASRTRQGPISDLHHSYVTALSDTLLEYFHYCRQNDAVTSDRVQV